MLSRGNFEEFPQYIFYRRMLKNQYTLRQISCLPTTFTWRIKKISHLVFLSINVGVRMEGILLDERYCTSNYLHYGTCIFQYNYYLPENCYLRRKASDQNLESWWKRDSPINCKLPFLAQRDCQAVWVAAGKQTLSHLQPLLIQISLCICSLIRICTAHLTVTEDVKKLLINFTPWNHIAWLHRQTFMYTCDKMH